MHSLSLAYPHLCLNNISSDFTVDSSCDKRLVKECTEFTIQIYQYIHFLANQADYKVNFQSSAEHI